MCVQGKLKKGKFVCLTCWQKQENNKKNSKNKCYVEEYFLFVKTVKKNLEFQEQQSYVLFVIL